ncbi:MAG TPA: NUDIX hydrolase [Candidatus Saccharimonadales bacterium]|nr:NUDIX hydrolase [Candidatus Saccharimonadales bacterium]
MKTIHRTIVSALIVSKDGKLLMGKKDAQGGGVYADCWHIPGGGVDPGEDKIAALRREVLEEVGIDVSNAKVELADDQGTGQAEKRLKDTGEVVLCKMQFNVYRINLDAPAPEISSKPSGDLVKLEWVSIPDLNKYKLTPPSQALFARLGYLA